MRLLPPYDKLVTGEHEEGEEPQPSPAIVSTLSDAEAFFEMISTKDIIALGLAIDFDFKLPPITLLNGSLWCDTRSIRPVFMALTALVGNEKPPGTVSAVIDLRVDGIATLIERILRLRIPFIFHGVKDTLHALWTLGIEVDVPQVIDTEIVALCLNLGYYHHRANQVHEADGTLARIAAESRLDQLRRHSASLVGQCAQYDLGYPYSDTPEERRLRRQSKDSHESDGSRRNAVHADAAFTAKLYLAQQADILRSGLFHQLYTVEFPFALANARMEWRGVQIDEDRCRRLRTAAHKAKSFYASVLTHGGITNPNDPSEFIESMIRKGIVSGPLGRNVVGNEAEILEDLAADNTIAAAFWEYRKASTLASSELLAGVFRGADGRVHPRHVQLGAATGRNTCVAPNVVGIGRKFRPIVTAPAGRALIELDYSQFEIGIAAAEHNDPELIAAYNDGDVYAAMAKRFYGVGQNLDAAEFLRQHRGLRDAMKTIVLAVIYNIQPRSLARKLRVEICTAAAERDRFLATFPELKAGLERSRRDGLVRSYASVVTGLRRRVELPVGDLSWTKNFLANTPIQGSATVVFKRAIAALDSIFLHTNTWLVLPIHDAILIECDIDIAVETAQQAAQVMKSSMRAIYPRLKPRVEVNRNDPTCWNKDGKTTEFNAYVDKFALETPP